jgi:hypothetical protein
MKAFLESIEPIPATAIRGNVKQKVCVVVNIHVNAAKEAAPFRNIISAYLQFFESCMFAVGSKVIIVCPAWLFRQCLALVAKYKRSRVPFSTAETISKCVFKNAFPHFLLRVTFSRPHWGNNARCPY